MVKLTHRSILALRPRNDRYEIGIEGVSGLRLRVLPSGRKAFYFQYQRSKKIKLGEFQANTLNEVRRLAAEARANVMRGGDPAAQHRDERRAENFRALAEKYLTFRERKGISRSIPEYRRMLEHDVYPVIGANSIRKITKRDINRVLDPIADRGVLAQHDHVLRLLRAIFKYGLAREELFIDPSFGLEAYKNVSTKERVLNRDEIRNFWQALDASLMWPATKIALKLMLVTGQRTIEIVQAEKRELFLEGVEPMWTIPATRTKNKREHRLPLSPLGVQLFEEAIRLSGDSEFVFPQKGEPAKPMHKDTPATALERALGSRSVGSAEKPVMNVERFTPHDLRRTMISHCEDTLEIDELIVERLANHVSAERSTVTRRHYLRKNYEPKMLQAVCRWGEWLKGALRAKILAEM